MNYPNALNHLYTEQCLTIIFSSYELTHKLMNKLRKEKKYPIT